jgi:hypothetical protein
MRSFAGSKRVLVARLILLTHFEYTDIYLFDNVLEGTYRPKCRLCNLFVIFESSE